YQRVEGGSACIGERAAAVCANDEDCKPQGIFSVCVVDTPTSEICTGKGGLCGVPCPPPGNASARRSS
ncbi:MAG TPA: hypothetical protein VFX03_05595, partial [Thermomicrobiales bacterium]|nr:hypothetical protein [Thermomicrobiales bacterium]